MVVNDVPMREKKSLPRWLASIVPSQLTKKLPSESSDSAHDDNQDYLLGVRGCLAIMTFLWMFMQTFAPAAVDASAQTDGAVYQLALRKSLSVLFWNESLIYSSIIFLSARTICLPFLLNPTKVSLASSVFRRPIKMFPPVAATLILCYILFTKALGKDYLSTFSALPESDPDASDIYALPSSLVNFNALVMIFFTSNSLSYQAGSWAFPTQTLWIVTAVFQQSYTVFTTMVIIPFTRKTWRLYGAALFILSAWWVYSWAWFSISGLLFADLVLNMDFKAKAQQNRLWSLGIAGACLAAGYGMQFVWVAARPDLQNAEIMYHTGPYNTGGLYSWNDTTAPQLRADDYLVIVGFYILLESTDFLQSIFRTPALVYIGKRSFSRPESYQLVNGLC
jgi:hypothetical protein